VISESITLQNLRFNISFIRPLVRRFSAMAEITQVAELIHHPQDIEKAAESLRGGGLVAFPTETVYGLGANALDEVAVRKIFEYKGRPLTDPLIVHVVSMEGALDLVELDEKEKDIFMMLGKRFWPGPLTLIAKAKPELPLCISAGTGFVGIRWPALPLAQELLAAAGVPVAAPSANRFSHVSPTSAEHVLADLGHTPIMVMDAGERGQDHLCEVGIESTVAKLEYDRQKLVLFRRGGVPERALADALQSSDCGKAISVEVVQKMVGHSEKSAETDGAVEEKGGQEEETGECAPGQLITHYSPDITSFLMTASAADVEALSARLAQAGAEGAAPADALALKAAIRETVIVDFAGALSSVSSHAIAYRDLSVSGSMAEAAKSLFACLRWAEEVSGAMRVLIVDFSETADDGTDAVFDRAFRACSGKRARVVADQAADADGGTGGECGGITLAFFDREGGAVAHQASSGLSEGVFRPS
jgi:tRNA threonylcarbamoyl adenosine modification protein (Sua5/YciO/YrdC/YwlC family)